MTTVKELPQLGDDIFLTDSGIETTLIYQDGFELPDFAAFVLLDDEAGRARLDRYFRDHAAVAAAAGTGFIIESPTWRASQDWGTRLGRSAAELAEANRTAVAMLVTARAQLDGGPVSTVVSGCIGPRGDGYDGTHLMGADQAQDYHGAQIAALAAGGADMVHAMTITYPDEAIGILRAAAAAGVPAAISFTVETDGALPDGTTVADAIRLVDAATAGTAAYYSINCAHPTHLPALDADAEWAGRLRGIRANASRRSHAELDAADELDAGDPAELAAQLLRLRAGNPNLTILGGCCGTDVRHIQAIADALPAG